MRYLRGRNRANLGLLAVLAALLMLAGACAGGGAGATVPEAAATLSPSPSATPSPVPTATPTPPPPPTAPTPLPPPTSTPSPLPTLEPTPFVPAAVILPTTVVPLGAPAAIAGDTLARALDAIEYEVNIVRDLSTLAPVDREFLDRDELRDLLLKLFEEDREDILQDQRLYTTIGILPGDTDLFDLLLGLYGEGVLGLYRAEEEKLYVVQDGEELGIEQQRTYVHEFVHALQQQHFDFQSVFDEREDNSDATAALTALVEGDARVAETVYAYEQMTEEERLQSQGTASQELIDAFQSAPQPIQRRFLFPYIEGVQFTLSLYQGQGFSAVDDAFTNPPASTEQVLHPEKYLSQELPVTVELPDFAAALGEGWDLIEDDTFGEFMLQAYLGAAVPQTVAMDAAAGWGGDTVSLLEGPHGETLAVLAIVWDTEPDAAEFYATFLDFTTARTGVQWAVEDVSQGQASRMRLAGQVIFLGRDAANTLVVFAPDDAAVKGVRTALARGG